MKNFRSLVSDVLKKYPTLSAEFTESGATLKGPLILNAEYNDIPLYDEYYVQIEVPEEFPKQLPNVLELSDSIPKQFQHFLDNGGLCLAAGCELIDYATENGTITGYISKYVTNYLYAASFFSRYGEVPFGERSHGIKGIKEAYMDRYKCDNEEMLVSLLCILVGIKKYRGHAICPCGSNMKLRDCHGNKVLKDIQSEQHKYYCTDAYLILSDYIKKEKGEIING